MRVIKDEFVDRGGVWHNVVGDTPIDVLNSAVSRMAKGYAPTLVQWHSGWEVTQIRNLGLLNRLDPEMFKFMQGALIDNVLDMVMVDGEIVAVPVNVHTENWLWFRKAGGRTVSASDMQDWTSFLGYAETLAENGETLLAVGDEPWQQRVLFNNVLLGEAGQQIYEKIYNELDVSALQQPEFLNAISYFRQLRQYSQSFGEGRWDQQVAAVAAQRAFGVIMGDWAKGEFRILGSRLGRDYDCIPAPGTKGNVILVIDVFVLGQVATTQEKQGQELFVEVVTDPDVSESFNYLKGSLSPLREIDADGLDRCNQVAHSTLVQKGKAIRPHASIGDRGFQADIDHAISTLWFGEDDMETWVDGFSKILEQERKKRRTTQHLLSE